MNIFKQLFGGEDKPDLQSIIDEGAFMVDVRSPQEFAQGNVKGSVNIPLDSLHSQLSKCEDKKNIIVFCRSGARSSQAKTFLEQNGFSNVINGGAWDNVKQYVK